MQPLPAMDEQGVVTQPDKCGFGTGSISGITATSAAGSLQFQWYNNTGEQTGNQAGLTGQKAGTYHLIITDINGCTLKSNDYAITQVVSPLPLRDMII
ncbi:hypothetical protein [Paraflavitalea speifideaquila]|uniref:hypothetical protein n=1 Tax=Paraflavitalea speifideaquila TaxID=3076558 RepID=UPI0028E198F7|nr:hypothetical protein [Paraflavitalea speifideiaquila]